jgi:hypothetical protein
MVMLCGIGCDGATKVAGSRTLYCLGSSSVLLAGVGSLARGACKSSGAQSTQVAGSSILGSCIRFVRRQISCRQESGRHDYCGPWERITRTRARRDLTWCHSISTRLPATLTPAAIFTYYMDSEDVTMVSESKGSVTPTIQPSYPLHGA